jgi:hypothetical protein
MAYVVVDQVFDLDIPHTPKAVLFSLARAVNHERYEESGDTRCWPSQATIAREIGVTPRTVRSAVKYLEDHQIAVPYAWGKGGPGVATRYRLYFDHVPRINKPIRNVEESSTLDSSPVTRDSAVHVNAENPSAQRGRIFCVYVDDFASNAEEIADEPGTEPGRFNQEAEAENASAASATAALTRAEYTRERNARFYAQHRDLTIPSQLSSDPAFMVLVRQYDEAAVGMRA